MNDSVLDVPLSDILIDNNAWDEILVKRDQ